MGRVKAPFKRGEFILIARDMKKSHFVLSVKWKRRFKISFTVIHFPSSKTPRLLVP